LGCRQKTSWSIHPFFCSSHQDARGYRKAANIIDQSLPGPAEDESHAAPEVFEDGFAVIEEPGHETFGHREGDAGDSVHIRAGNET